MDKWMGSNINGPSIIRMPNWCKNRLGKELHESIPAIEALETYLKERNIGEEKIRLLLEKGQNLISENPPQ